MPASGWSTGRAAYADAEDQLSAEIDRVLADALDLRGEVAAWYDEVSPLRLSGDGWAA